MYFVHVLIVEAITSFSLKFFSLNRNVNIALPLIKCMTVCIKANLKTKQCYDNTMIWNQFRLKK